jgi:hypothetical protein
VKERDVKTIYGDRRARQLAGNSVLAVWIAAVLALFLAAATAGSGRLLAFHWYLASIVAVVVALAVVCRVLARHVERRAAAERAAAEQQQLVAAGVVQAPRPVPQASAEDVARFTAPATERVVGLCGCGAHNLTTGCPESVTPLSSATAQPNNPTAVVTQREGAEVSP